MIIVLDNLLCLVIISVQHSCVVKGRLDSRGRFEASRGEGNESAARAVARRVREQMQGPPDDEPRAHRSWDILAPDRDLGTPSGHRRVYEDRDVRGRNRVSMGIG